MFQGLNERIRADSPTPRACPTAQRRLWRLAAAGARGRPQKKKKIAQNDIGAASYKRRAPMFLPVWHREYGG